MGSKTATVLPILFILWVSLVWSLSLYPANCPEPEVMENFDIEKFNGRWYEVQRTFALVEGGLKCATTVITDANNTRMRATFRRNGINILKRRVTLMRGHLHTPDAKTPAKLELVMGPLSLFLRYRIIDTNYDDYAVVWGCFESPKYSSILGHTGMYMMLNVIPLNLMTY
ncbi:Apolipoprotein D like protein [Argiope bruennichi]|uniref:Apolipoprotein D like protein n=2 Tax=Araneidae TaxID=6913 RepID=A0A8T0F399_ARGBR|nr:Apolipoprotein D like protein [Argiope bruennichi]